MAMKIPGDYDYDMWQQFLADQSHKRPGAKSLET